MSDDCNAFEYSRKNLNSNVGLVGKYTSVETVNSWGIIKDKDCGYWVANNGSNFLTLYSKKGILLKNIVVTGNAPTGLVDAKSCSFGNYKLITATENGTIEGWNGVATNTTIVVTTVNAVYKGLALKKSTLYVCNFHSGFVEVYNNNFALVKTFTDQALVNAGYAPFNVAVHDCHIYVTFAKQDDAKHDDVKGDGFGYIDVFNKDGLCLRRFINREPLNAPWGLMFSQCGKHLYVGNFGDGRINVFNIKCGTFITPLTDKNGNIIVLDGLWGIVDDCDKIAFASGIDAEANGLVGILI
jgi:uncharacterized protein (TIGR03118 family)